MPLLKRTYALPQRTIEQFEQMVAPGQRSSVLAALLQEWLEEQRRQQLRQEIITGCQEMGAIYQEMEQAYHPLEEEVQRALDSTSKTRRHRPRAARSRRRV
jgi:metal-responsive CopG/Arc/MetJ family transcriptional regulator